MSRFAARNRRSFNTQPPEGGWAVKDDDTRGMMVSTHSRLKAAGSKRPDRPRGRCFCFNTQPPEGGWVGRVGHADGGRVVSTHSRLKAAGLGLN